jgi:hypothetical protein
MAKSKRTSKTTKSNPAGSISDSTIKPETTVSSDTRRLGSSIIKSTTSKSSSKLKGNSKSFSVASYDYKILDALSKNIQEEEIRLDFLNHLIAGAVAIIIMVQIRLSDPSSSQQYFDGLPSFKLYKKRLISGIPGRTWCIGISLAEAIEFVPESESLDKMVIAYSENEIIPCKPTGKPTKNNYGEFISYRMTQILGTLSSCPASNIKVFSLPLECINWGLQEALKFIAPDRVFEKKDISRIEEILVENLTLNEGGLPTGVLNFGEPSSLNSKIEKEIFGELIARDGSVSSTLGLSGSLPSSPITGEMVAKYLSKREFVMYEVALRNGDKSRLNSLNRKIQQAAMEEAKTLLPGMEAEA